MFQLTFSQYNDTLAVFIPLQIQFINFNFLESHLQTLRNSKYSPQIDYTFHVNLITLLTHPFLFCLNSLNQILWTESLFSPKQRVNFPKYLII